MKIAVDAMGGDLGPEEIVKGVAEAAKRGTHIVLVGAQKMVEPMLQQYSTNSHVSIHDAPEVIGFEETPTKAVRRKTNSSIVAGIDLLKRGQVSAFVSAGHTGAVVTAAVLNLGRAKGVQRPALAILFPTMAGPALILDIGANSDCKPQFLMGFAQMGNSYALNALRIPHPRVGLLSNGEESCKGNRLVRQAHKMLENSKLNFVGNLEGKDIIRGNADVVVTDGFTGNIMIKAIEGFGELIFQMLARSLNGKNGSNQEGASSFKTAVGEMTKRLDWSEHGGAVLLGVKGTVVVAHGRSRANAITNAIRNARLAADRLPSTS